MSRKPIIEISFSCIILMVLVPDCYLFSQGLTINTGATVVVNGAANIVVNNTSFNNSGTFSSGTSTVSLTGTAPIANSYIGGSSTTSFYNLQINKTSGDSKLMQAAAVSNSLYMAGKNLDLNGFDLDLGTTGNMSGENESSYVFGPLGGYIIKSINLSEPSAVNPGNMGLEITSAANLGASIIKRGHQQQVTARGHSINRYFDVFAANNSELNATVRFYYLNAELASITESELQMWTSANSGATWNLQGSNIGDASDNYVSKNNIAALNRVTLASAVNSPLPITLLYFSAQLENDLARLTWATSAEVNNDHFEVQRSLDGRSFQSIATVAGAGTSNAVHEYNYLDGEPVSKVTYYRLKQVNRDGSVTFSKILSVNANPLYNDRLVQVYPNPTLGPVSISFTSSMARQVTIQVTDIRGKIISNKVVDVSKGLNKVDDNMVMLAQGTYFIRIVGIDDRAFKIFKY